MKNSIIIVTGEYGSGKETICHYLEEIGRKRIISCTTRPKRPSEQDGVDYHFLTHEEFQKRKDNSPHGIFEYREVLVNGEIEYFGSEEVPLQNGELYTAVLDNDGVASYLEKYGSDACFIVKLDVPEDIRKERAWERDNKGMPMMGTKWNTFCYAWEERKAYDIKRFGPDAYPVNLCIRNTDNPMRVAFRIAVAAELDARKGSAPVPCHVLEKTWENIVKIYREHVCNKSSVECVREIFKSEGIWNTMATFALVVSLKSGDGRIYREYRDVLAQIPLDGKTFYTEIDAIHSAHINNMLYDFLL